MTAVAVISALVTGAIQWGRSLKLRRAEHNTALRAHAEKFSCWVSGRVKDDGGDPELQVNPSQLIVTLTNASEQPFTEAVVEVRFREAQGAASTNRFTVSVVPPGTSWFAFDSNGKKPLTLILPIWFLDNEVRSWARSSVGELLDSSKPQRLDKSQGAAHVWLHRGDPVEALRLDDAWAKLPQGAIQGTGGEVAEDALAN